MIVALAGGFAGFMSGLLGIGGGFVVVPALFLLAEPLGIETGVAMHMALGTSLAAMIATTARSAFAHDKLGSVHRPTLRRLVPWVVAGAILGAMIASSLKGAVLTGIFALAAFGLSIRTYLGKEPSGHAPPHTPLMIQYIAGVLIGFASAVIGIGGAAFGTPLLNRLGLNFRQVIGTAACIGVSIAIPAAILYGLTGLGVASRPPWSIGYVSVPGCALIFATTSITTRYGLKVHAMLSANALRLVFSGFLMVTALRMAISLI